MRMRARFVNLRIASARNVAQRWREQYPEASGKRHDQWKELDALGDNADIEKVVDIIGNKSWSHVSCDGCSEYVVKAVEIGQYEAKVYCEVCIREALETFNL